jgi:bifunctional DNA-binding transcriptional regulator/antitoxin component of YhaV-PrlF toxin-antitoxin module
MTDSLFDVTANSQGRVVLPAELRRELGITPDVPMIAYIEDGRLVLETRMHALRRAQTYVTSRVPADVSLVDDLIAERRAAAAKESTS